MALHAKYMANAAKAEYGPDDAATWSAAQEQNMGNIDTLFAPVQYSSFYEKIFFTERAMGAGWDKLAIELDATHRSPRSAGGHEPARAPRQSVKAER
ncbi:MAG: hypothetical protein ACI9U2_002920 [Bradymonadia bacterium]|jgi:hypothetical protein